MKRLTCEMCGSTDLIKQDGVFVCQTCGCKYSIEEAKKMMVEGTVEVTGTVKVDNSAAITNYLDMAQNAMEAGNNKEADDYCNKIIEMDVTNWEAWFIKGKAVGWQSTLGNIRISETINAFSKALENCPEDKKEKLGKDCKFELEQLQSALLTTRMNTFKMHPNENNVNGLRNDVAIILNTAMNFLTKSNIAVDALGNINFATVVNRGICAAWEIVFKDYQGDNGHPTDYEFTRFIDEGDCLIEGLKFALLLCGEENTNPEITGLKAQIYDNLIQINTAIKDSQSYQLKFSGNWKYYDTSKSLSGNAKQIRQRQIDEWRAKISEVRVEGEQAARKADQEKRAAAQKAAEEEHAIMQKKLDEYWKNHAEEKAQIESLEIQQDELQKQSNEVQQAINSLKEKINSLPSTVQREMKHKEAEDLRSRIQKLGFFQGKEKKRLQEQLKAITSDMESLTKAITSEREEIEKEIAPLNQQINDLTAKKRVLAEKIAQINATAAFSAVENKDTGNLTTTNSSNSQPITADTYARNENRRNVFLINAGPCKMQVIKLIKEITSLDLKRSTAIANGTQKIIKENITQIEAEGIRDKLESIGATVEIR